jgi:hypothetical protein
MSFLPDVVVPLIFSDGHFAYGTAHKRRVGGTSRNQKLMFPAAKMGLEGVVVAYDRAKLAYLDVVRHTTI